jgi:protein SCO1/2
MTQRILKGLLTAVAALSLAACTEDPNWNAKDVSGLMPDLQFELARAPSGDTVTAADYAGKIKLVFFGFTYCRDVCPATMAKLGQALSAMPEQTADDVRVLFVSVDPKRDTPQRLADYTSGFGERFVGLLGEIDYLRELTKRYRTTFSHGEPNEDGHYMVSHSSAVFVFDRSGKLRLLAKPDQSINGLVADLERLVESG